LQKSNIEWCTHTSNPIRGKCQHECPYCYAERIRVRFDQPAALSWIGKELVEIEKRKKSATIFMGSMYDIFGSWVPIEMPQIIIDTAKRSPQHTFLFLTKNPVRYGIYDFPNNCWIGYSDDGTKDMRHWVHFKGRKNTFISFEPLIGRSINVNMALVGSVIIGAMTGSGKNNIRPDRDIVDGIISAAGSKPVYLKNNLLALFPDLQKRQETAWTR